MSDSYKDKLDSCADFYVKADSNSQGRVRVGPVMDVDFIELLKTANDFLPDGIEVFVDGAIDMNRAVLGRAIHQAFQAQVAGKLEKLGEADRDLPPFVADGEVVNE